MGGIIATARAACNTATGTQDITATGLTATPVAAFFTVTYATSDGVAADEMVIGVGAATGASNRWACCASSEHNEASVDSYRRATKDECVMILNPADGTIDGEADFDSFIPGGVRIDWGNAPSAGFLINVLFIAGPNAQAHANHFDITAGTMDITDPGFEPTFLILSAIDAATDDTSSGHGILGLGLVANGSGGVQQGHIVTYSRDGRPSGDTRGGISNTLGYGASTTTDWKYTLSFGSFDASGFSATLTGTEDTDDDICYLAVSLGDDVDTWVGGIDTPTATGDEAYTGPGFKPQAVITLPSWFDTWNSWDGGSSIPGSKGISVVDVDDEYCTSGQDEDGSGTTDTQSLSDDTAISFPYDDGSSGFVASLASLDDNGWTWNFSATDTGTVRKWVALAIEESVGDSLASLDGNLRKRRFQPLLVR